VLAVADDEPARSFDFAQDDPVGFGFRLSIYFQKIKHSGQVEHLFPKNKKLGSG